MKEFKEYDQFDGLGLARLVKNREISPEELCEEAIRRIERMNPKINAVVTPMFDYARNAVAGSLPDGPFTGVPFLLKDLLTEFAGVPTSRGSKACRHDAPGVDCEMVRRFKKAGLLILGKTNTPEFGLMGVTEPELFGPARNPWNLDHTPGGSSGGSAAAAAAGMVPMASGGDGGGSIRIPSACCGLFGLKPTRGRTPTGPRDGERWQGATVEHVITRSVRDSAAVLDAVQGADSGAPYVIQAPEKPYLEEIGQAPRALRIAFNVRSPLETPVHPECVQAVEAAARLLEELGHRVEEAAPKLDGIRLAQSYLTMYFGEVAADIEELEGVLKRKLKPGDLETVTWTLGLMGRTVSAGAFVRAIRQWHSAAREMGRFHERFDLYLTPTLAHPPVKIGELQPMPLERAALTLINAAGLGRLLKATGIMDKMAVKSLEKTPFTQLANFTGQPAMSVPLHWTREGLPCGVQFIAPFGDEATLLRLAAQLEEARPWFHRRPPPIG